MKTWRGTIPTSRAACLISASCTFSLTGAEGQSRMRPVRLTSYARSSTTIGREATSTLVEFCATIHRSLFVAICKAVTYGKRARRAVFW